jgi:hypothetical protein
MVPVGKYRDHGTKEGEQNGGAVLTFINISHGGICQLLLILMTQRYLVLHEDMPNGR